MVAQPYASKSCVSRAHSSAATRSAMWWVDAGATAFISHLPCPAACVCAAHPSGSRTSRRRCAPPDDRESQRRADWQRRLVRLHAPTAARRCCARWRCSSRETFLQIAHELRRIVSQKIGAHAARALRHQEGAEQTNTKNKTKVGMHA